MQQPQTNPPRVEMINITKTYGSIRSLRGVNLELAPGEVLGLVGDNGAEIHLDQSALWRGDPLQRHDSYRR